MRFNDEVQFTLCLVRVPDDLPEIIAAAPHRSISTDCMTQGDTVCLPRSHPKYAVGEQVEAEVAAYLERTYGTPTSNSDIRAHPGDMQKSFAAGFDSVNGVRASSNTLLTAQSHTELINQVLNDVFDKTVRKPVDYDELWAKYDVDYEAMYAMPAQAALYLGDHQITVYPDPDAYTAACGELAPKGPTNGEGLRDVLLRAQRAVNKVQDAKRREPRYW